MIAGAKSPEICACQLHGARRSRLDGQREDRSTESGGIAWWKASELTLGRWSELDTVFTVAHPSSGS